VGRDDHRLGSEGIEVLAKALFAPENAGRGEVGHAGAGHVGDDKADPFV
jgi:hypothetical protein